MTKLFLIIPAIAFIFSILVYNILRIWGKYKADKRAAQLDTLKSGDCIIISHPRYYHIVNFIARNGDKIRVHAWTKLGWDKEDVIIENIHFVKIYNGQS